MLRAIKTASAVTTVATLLTAGAASASSIYYTGPGSYNSIRTSYYNRTTRINNNWVSLSNTNYQTAVSGNANVSWNTWGGSAVTGNASNYNSTNFSVNIRN